MVKRNLLVHTGGSDAAGAPVVGGGMTGAWNDRIFVLMKSLCKAEWFYKNSW